MNAVRRRALAVSVWVAGFLNQDVCLFSKGNLCRLIVGNSSGAAGYAGLEVAPLVRTDFPLR